MEHLFRHICLCFVLVAALARAAEIPVHTNAVADQEHVVMTQLVDGSIVFAWEDESAGVSEIWFRRFDSNLIALSAPVRAHATLPLDQKEPAIAPLTNGFVLTWASSGLDGSDYGIAFIRFFTNGTPLDGSNIVANTTTANAQLRPDVAPLTGGGFVIVWDDQSGAFAGDGDQDVRYRRFAADRTPLDANDVVANGLGTNPRVQGTQGNGRVAGLTNGSFVIVYEDRSGDDVWGVRVDGAGNAMQAPGLTNGSRQFVVNALLTYEQTAPAVSSFTNGAFVAVYNSETDGTPNGRRVLARYFSPGGVAATNELMLGSFAQRTQDARVAAGTNGTFVAAMQSLNVGPDAGSNTWSALLQRASTNGSVLIPSFLAHSYVINDQDRPAVLALRDGSYVAAWQSFGQDTNRYGIYAQRFAASGSGSFASEPGRGRILISRLPPPGTNFLVTFTNGAPYVPYRWQASANLSNWSTIQSATSSNGAFQYTETKNGALPTRAYRVVTP